MGEEGERDEDWFEKRRLVVRPGEEEVGVTGGEGAREQGDEGCVGYVEGCEGRERVGGVALDTVDWRDGISMGQREELMGKGSLRHQTGLWPLRPRVEERARGGGYLDGKYSPFSRSGGDSSTGDGSSSCSERSVSRDSAAFGFFSIFKAASQYRARGAAGAWV